MADREVKAEDKYVAYVEADGCECVKMNIRGRRGWPDRHTVYPNGSFYIEFKRTDTDLTPLQIYIHKKLRGLNYGVYVAHTYEEALKIYKEQRYGKK